MELKDAPNLTPTPVLGGAPVQSKPAPEHLPGAPASLQDAAAVAEVKAEDPDFSQKFAALTRKQKEIFIKEQDLKKREEKTSKYENLMKLRDEDPYKYAKETGLDLDRLILGATKDGQPETADDKIAKIEKRIAEYAKQIEDDKQAAQHKVESENIDRFKKSIETTLKADPDKYELIHLEGAYEDVFGVIDEHFARTSVDGQPGELLTIEDAAQKVEEFLLNRAIKYRQAKKLGFGKEQTPAPEPEPQAPQAPLQNDDHGATLSASMTSRTPAPAPQYESPEESRRRIAAQFQAQLKPRT